MASVQKRPDGKWRARYRDPLGRERARHFDRKIDAERWLDSVNADLVRGEYIAPEGGRILFSDRYERCSRSWVNLRESTVARDESYGRSLILPTFAKHQLGSIDHDAVQEWVAQLAADGRAAATIHRAHQIMSKVMRSAVQSKLIASNPCDATQLPRIVPQEQLFLSPSEVATLSEAIDSRYRILVLTAAYSGLRAGELYGLRRDRVDLDQCHLDVLENLTEVKGHIKFGPPKTRSGRRRVPIPRFAVDALADHLATAKPDDLVFTAPDGGPVRATLFRRRFWQPACLSTGVGKMVPDPRHPGKFKYEGLRLHDLRHTTVSFWIAAGASPNEIARRAGHSSVVTVLDRYGHLLPGAEDNVTDKLDAMARAAASDTTNARTIDLSARRR